MKYIRKSSAAGGGGLSGVETEGIIQPIKRENQHVGTVTRTYKNLTQKIIIKCQVEMKNPRYIFRLTILPCSQNSRILQATKGGVAASVYTHNAKKLPR